MRTVLDHSAFRYLVVGTASFLVDLGVLAFCYTVVGLPLWVATATGFWVSFFFNFFVQRRFSFGASVSLGASAWRYGALLAVNTVLNVVVVELFERSGLGFATGKLVITAAQTVLNYFAYRYWVFASHQEPGRSGVQPTSR